jgi:hypothetical protein
MFKQIRVSTVIIFVGAALAVSEVLPLKADDLNYRTVVSFGSPVELSGQILPAGSYVFRTLGVSDLVTVTSLTGNHRYGTFHTVPLGPRALLEKARVDLERHGDGPDSVHVWFYPGAAYGFEFARSKSEK